MAPPRQFAKHHRLFFEIQGERMAVKSMFQPSTWGASIDPPAALRLLAGLHLSDRCPYVEQSVCSQSATNLQRRIGRGWANPVYHGWRVGLSPPLDHRRPPGLACCKTFHSRPTLVVSRVTDGMLWPLIVRQLPVLNHRSWQNSDASKRTRYVSAIGNVGGLI